MAVNIVQVTTLNRVRLYQGQPGTTAATVYTVPAATDVKVAQLVLCNTTTGTPTATVSLVGSGGAAGAANQVVSGLTLAANETVVFQLDSFLTTGDFIAVSASAAATVTVTISGETYA